MSSRVWQWITIRGWLVVCGALLVVLLAIQTTSLRHKGLTTDEPLHYQYGYRVLNGAPERTSALNASTMPFSSVHAMTSGNLALVASMIGISTDASWTDQLKRGRYATIALSLLLALYIVRWSYELYGRNGALLSLSLCVFDPNLLAHGQLVTADLPAALMTTVALYHFWHFLKLGGKQRAVFSAVTLGLSQLAKYSCVYLYPIFLAIAAIYCRFRPASGAAKPDQSHSPTWNLRRWLMAITFFGAVSIITINLGFDFAGVGTPLSGYTLKDPFFKKLEATPIIGNLPLPLPVPYIQGLDLVKFEERMGEAWGNIYMAGQLRVNHHDGTLHGFPGYYFYAAFFKVPIAKQIIFFMALFGYFSKRRQPAALGLRREEIFLLIPILVYWVYLNFFFNAEVGIRHVLPVFALATIFCGRFLAAPASKVRRFTAVILAVWAAASALSYYPHFISYFNEFVPDRKLAYRHLADSNLDWRGNEWYLKQYVRRHPGVIVDPRKPQAGRIVVPVNALVGVNRNPDEYRWLREHFTPVDHIAYSFLVYDVPKRMLPQGGRDSKAPKAGAPSTPPHD
ncbi:MAG: glycosyltransferase family 39 protein [Candidatus Udaeobacter sp.]